MTVLVSATSPRASLILRSTHAHILKRIHYSKIRSVLDRGNLVWLAVNVTGSKRADRGIIAQLQVSGKILHKIHGFAINYFNDK